MFPDIDDDDWNEIGIKVGVIRLRRIVKEVATDVKYCVQKNTMETSVYIDKGERCLCSYSTNYTDSQCPFPSLKFFIHSW